jgi:quercetin dioxygenase-like cupin family protein
MDIHPCGSRPSSYGSAEHFKGRVRFDPVLSTRVPARAVSLIVTFEPGARTAWHTHPLGQTLFVLSGVGLVQSMGGEICEIRPGDTVWIAPGEKHWHGAGHNVAMSHLAIQEDLEGSSINWLEKDEL